MPGVRTATIHALALALLLGGVSTSAQVRINNKSDLPGGLLNSPYSTQLIAGGGTAPFQFSITSGYFPSGVTLSPSGLISGTIFTPGVYFIGVRVVDSRNESVTKDFRLGVHGLPVKVVLESKIDTPVGVPLRKNIRATGGALAPYRISFLSGTLPPGFNFVKEHGGVSQAVLSGTPLKEGSYSATFEARDEAGLSGTATMVINVLPNPIRILPFTLPAGIVGEEYEFDIPVQSGFSTVRCVSSSALPPGLILTAGCRLRGLVTNAATLDLRAIVADGAGASATATGVAQFRIPDKLTITTANQLPAGAVGQTYRKQLLLRGGLAGRTAVSSVPRWTVISGLLPAGLRLDINQGVISGSPTAEGPRRFTAEYAGPEGTAIKTFDITIGAQPYVWDSPADLGSINAGQVATLPTGIFRGGVPGGRHHLVSGAWPPGMAPQDDGAIFGTPLAAGNYVFTLESKSTDGQVVSKDFRVVVQPALGPVIRTRTPGLPDAIAGIPYFFADYAPGCSCAANDGSHPYKWQGEISSNAGLPPGLTLRADGELSGTPLAPGAYSFPLLLSDASGRTVSQRYTLNVLPFFGTLSLLPPSPLPPGVIGSPYQAQLAASGGTSPIAFTAPSGLPAFLSLSQAGLLSGAAPTAGNHQFVIRVKDSQPEGLGGPLSVTRTYDLLVSQPQSPVIARLEPARVPAGRPALQLAVFGSGFTSASAGFADGARRLATRFDSAATLTLEIPASLMQQPGVVRITISTGSLTSNFANLTIDGAPPAITSLQPVSAQAGGSPFTLTVDGSGFQNGAAVRWNGAPLPTAFLSASRLTASVAANLIAAAGSVSLSVVNPDGLASNPVAYAIAAAAAPQIGLLSPASAVAGSGDFTLTVAGTNFAGGAVIRWNGSALQTTYVSSSQLSATLPAVLVATAGSASVTVANPDGQTSAASTFSITQAPAPRISGLNPPSAQAGSPAFTLTVNGANFVNGAAARWNGSPLTTTFVNASQLTASVSAALVAAAGSASVTVANPDGQTSAASTFAVSSPPPQISSLNPPSAQAGSSSLTLTVNGSAFAAGAAVRWNNASLPTTFVSATQLTATVATNLITAAGSATVTVTNPDAQSSAPAGFTITPAPAPQITSLNPPTAQAGSTAILLTVTGTNFQSGAVIRWNGADLITAFASTSQITATIPSGLLASTASASVTVANLDGQVSPSATFTIAAPPPQILSLNPASVQAGATAFTLSVTGSGFQSASTVRWNGSPLSTAFASATQLSGNVPASLVASAGSASITVANPDSQTSATATFTINPTPAPQISGLSPTSAQAGGGAFTLSVDGSNFQSGAAVRWNGSPLLTVFLSQSQLTASVAASLIATAGSAAIAVSNPDQQTSAPLVFSISQPAAPQITALNPASALAGGPGFPLTVTGANFLTGAVVRWNGADLATTYVSSSQLSASVTPAQIASFGPASVVVANPTGQTSAPAQFSISAPAPQISALAPAAAQADGAGFTLTVTGANFQSNVAIRWNGTPLPTTFISSTQAAASVSAALISAPGTATITAVNADGQASSSAAFSITAPPPQILSLNPPAAQAGNPAFQLTVNGTNFAAGAAVRWNAAPLATTFVSATQLTAAVSESLLTTPGPAAITVSNPDGQTSPQTGFAIGQADPAQPQTLVPSSAQAGGPAFTLTVNGAGFQTGATVRWNGADLLTSFVSASQLRAAAPANLIAAPGSASVVVRNPDNQISPALSFTIIAPPPQISAINPASMQAGSPAFPLSVNGSGFQANATVRWNGSPLATTFVNAQQLTANVPASLTSASGSASITVANSDGQTSAAASFAITAPSPQITSLAPSSAQAGSAAFTLTVTGFGFSANAAVRWNGSALTTAFVSATQLTAGVPAPFIASAGSASITVANPDGQSSGAATLTITLAPGPQISSLAPSSAQAGGAPFPLTINGTNFSGASIVRWNGADVPTTFLSPTQLSANISGALIASAGSANVTVVNADGQISAPSAFAVTPAPPQITSLSPSSAQAGGPAFTLTVNGSGFQNAAVVRWNGAALTTTFVSASTLRAGAAASLIAAAGSANISVLNPDSQVSAAAAFPISLGPLPAISSLSPSAATAGGPAFLLTVTGNNFGGGAVVRWNGADLNTTFVSATQLTATVEPNLIANAGSASIVVLNPDGQSSVPAAFPISAVAPQITSLSPATAQSGGAAFTLTINGTNFQSGATARWNGATIPTTFVSPAQLTANVAATLIAVPGTAAVTVANSDQQVSAAASFSISQPPAPQITALNPASAIAGGAAFTLNVQGSNFSAGSAVKWNGAQLQTLFVSAAQLSANIPANLIAAQGSASLAVVNADGQASAALSFPISLAPRPEILSLSPASAAARSAGFTLSLTGRNFQAGVTVRWNTAALATTFVSATQLSADVPAGLLNDAGAASVLAANPDGQSSAPSNFTITARTPQITSLAPPSAQAASPAFTLTVRGSDFSSGGQIRWNGTPLSTSFVSATELSAAIAANLIVSAGSAAVTVANADGLTSAPATFSITQAAAPTITSLTPNSARAAGAAFDIAIQGANFQNGSVARWNGAALATNFVSATQLTAKVTANLIAAAGTASVTVTNPDTQVSAAANFTITQGLAPQILSMNPGTAQAGSPAFSLIVNGGNLQSGAAVRWNGAALPTTQLSEGQLSANVAAALIASAAPVSITIANPDAQVSTPVVFTVTAPPPQITLLTPGSVQAGGAAFTLSVQGLNFQSGAAVRWNDTPLPTTFGSATQLSATVAANLFATAGTASVVVTLTDGQTSAPVNFSIGAAPSPIITGLSPDSAVAGGAGFTLTVQGANFHSLATLRWSGTTLTTSQTSATQITATVPAALLAAAGPANIVVTNPDGQASTPKAFTVAAPPPRITSLSPASAQALSAAFTLRVNGTAFQNGATVRWSGATLTTSFVSATQLDASVPANLLERAGSAAISVRNPDNQISSDTPFTIAAPPKPSITGIAPGSIVAGAPTTVITVNGANFVSGAVVAWGGTQLATAFGSGAQLTAVVPQNLLAAVVSAAVTVRNPDGQVSDPFALNVTAPQPSLLSIAPSSALAGTSTDLTLTITGQNFRAGAEVRWNGYAIPTLFFSATQLTALVAPNLLASAGNAVIAVRNSDGSLSPSLVFPVLNPAPQVSNLSPTAVPAGSNAFALAVTGLYFTADSQVLWNGTPLPTTFTSPALVTAQVSAALIAQPGAASVGVRNSETQVSNTQRFTISETSTPEIGRLNPLSAPVNGPAFQLAVSGANFQSESQVLWNNIALVTTFVSANTLAAAVPASLLTVAASIPITVRNASGRLSQPAAFEVGEPLQFLSGHNLPDAQLGVAYRAELMASGGAKPYRWSLASGSAAPAGLELAAAGILQGTPTTAAESFLDIEVRDSVGALQRQRFRLLVVSRPFEITSASPLPQGTAGTPYSFRLQTGETIADPSWTLLDGELPAGLDLNPLTGELSGTPLEPAEENADPRTYRFHIQVTAAEREARKIFELTIQPARNGLRLASPSTLPEARIGRVYQTRIAAVGGRPPYTYAQTAGTLPRGITFTSDGLVEGTPTQGGAFSFTVRAVDADQRTASETYSLTVTEGAGPQIITGPVLQPGTPGQPYNAALQATGGRLPYRWSLLSGALPLGVAFDPSQARVSGVPQRAGLFRFTARVTDADNRADTRTFELPVLPLGEQTLQFSTTGLPSATVGVPYRAAIATSGGTAPYLIAVRTGALPPGLRLEAGTIAGTPTEAGGFTVSLRVTDATGARDDRDFVLNIALAPLPTITIGGIADTINPGQQSLITVDLSVPYPSEVLGRLEMDFTSEPEVQGIDPALQFSTGGRAVEFRIPAGQTRAIFPQTPFGLQAGTVAGLIRIRIILRVSGRETRPANEPERIIRIVQTPPVISSASLERTSGGFNIIVVGFSSTREVADGVAVLNPAPGRLIESTRLTVPLTGAFKTWYDTSMSLPFGTQFRLVLPFTGDPASVESLTFVLRNGRGSSNEVRLTF